MTSVRPLAINAVSQAKGVTTMLRYLLAAAIITVPIAAAFAQSDEGPPRWAANIVRKQQVIMHGIPQS